jgi:type II secretory pathway component PulK
VNNLLNNQRGSVAIMLVLSTIAIVTPFMVNFSYDSQLNKLKVYNIEDRAKAKLTSESGLQFAMARLKLYKEAYNFLQKQKDAKSLVKPELLDTLWNFPFVYPIPITKNMNLIQKEAIRDFQEKTLIEGGMQLTIENISNRINLNLLRLSIIEDEIKKSQTKKEENPTDPPEEDTEFNPEAQLAKIMKKAIESRSETDSLFEVEYGGTEIDVLINQLKYYISDPDSIEDAAGGDEAFQSEDLTAKQAPLASYSEIFGLPAWPDDITNLIRREFTVHGSIMIDLNKITDKLLQILIPDITPEDIKEFFEYRDDPDSPKHFNSLEDFKKYIVNIGNIMNESDFDERFKKFVAQGLKFGPTPTLFKVISVGNYERSTYTLTAYVIIPAQPKERLPEPADLADETEEERKIREDAEAKAAADKAQALKDSGAEPAKEDENTTPLLSPRIVEIIIS